MSNPPSQKEPAEDLLGGRDSTVYEVLVGCSNCGWKGKMTKRRGEKLWWGDECAHCGCSFTLMRREP